MPIGIATFERWVKLALMLSTTRFAPPFAGMERLPLVFGVHLPRHAGGTRDIGVAEGEGPRRDRGLPSALHISGDILGKAACLAGHVARF